jgi:hypothetical protein
MMKLVVEQAELHLVMVLLRSSSSVPSLLSALFSFRDTGAAGEFDSTKSWTGGGRCPNIGMGERRVAGKQREKKRCRRRRVAKVEEAVRRGEGGGGG